MELKILVMDCYIIVELIGLFFFGVGLFLFIGIIVGVMFELVWKVIEFGLFIFIVI